mgnify:CR=1 FL=1
MQDYRKLDVWKLSHELTMQIYRVTAEFPADERYNLTSQIRRSCVSIPSNIAEGCGRSSNAELMRFLYIAMGSAQELDYQLFLSAELTYIPKPTYDKTKEQLTILQKKLNRFIQTLKY